MSKVTSDEHAEEQKPKEKRFLFRKQKKEQEKFSEMSKVTSDEHAEEQKPKQKRFRKFRKDQDKISEVSKAASSEYTQGTLQQKPKRRKFRKKKDQDQQHISEISHSDFTEHDQKKLDKRKGRKRRWRQKRDQENLKSSEILDLSQGTLEKFTQEITQQKQIEQDQKIKKKRKFGRRFKKQRDDEGIISSEDDQKMATRSESISKSEAFVEDVTQPKQKKFKMFRKKKEKHAVEGKVAKKDSMITELSQDQGSPETSKESYSQPKQKRKFRGRFVKKKREKHPLPSTFETCEDCFDSQITERDSQLEQRSSEDLPQQKQKKFGKRFKRKKKVKDLSSSERSPESEVIRDQQPMEGLTRDQETLSPYESEISKESLPKHKEKKFGKLFRRKKKESPKSSEETPESLESEVTISDFHKEKSLTSSEVSEERKAQPKQKKFGFFRKKEKKRPLETEEYTQMSREIASEQKRVKTFESSSIGESQTVEEQQPKQKKFRKFFRKQQKEQEESVSLDRDSEVSRYISSEEHFETEKEIPPTKKKKYGFFKKKKKEKPLETEITDKDLTLTKSDKLAAVTREIERTKSFEDYQERKSIKESSPKAYQERKSIKETAPKAYQERKSIKESSPKSSKEICKTSTQQFTQLKESEESCKSSEKPLEIESSEKCKSAKKPKTLKTCKTPTKSKVCKTESEMEKSEKSEVCKPKQKKSLKIILQTFKCPKKPTKLLKVCDKLKTEEETECIKIPKRSSQKEVCQEAIIIPAQKYICGPEHAQQQLPCKFQKTQLQQYNDIVDMGSEICLEEQRFPEDSCEGKGIQKWFNKNCQVALGPRETTQNIVGSVLAEVQNILCVSVKKVEDIYDKDFRHFLDRVKVFYNKVYCQSSNEIDEVAEQCSLLLKKVFHLNASLKSAIDNSQQVNDLLLKIFQKDTELTFVTSEVFLQLIDTMMCAKCGMVKLIEALKIHCDTVIPETRKGLKVLQQLRAAEKYMDETICQDYLRDDCYCSAEENQHRRLLHKRMREHLEIIALKKGFLYESLRCKVFVITSGIQENYYLIAKNILQVKKENKKRELRKQ